MNTTRSFLTLTSVLITGLAVSTVLAIPPVPADIVAKQGDLIGGSTIDGLSTPFTNGHGQVGFVVSMGDGDRAVWFDNGPIFFYSDDTAYTLTGSESTMGISDSAGFIVGNSVDGNDAAYTHGGPLLVEGERVPNMPGYQSTFNSRCQMLPDGTAHWMGGIAPLGSTSTENRILFRATDPTDPDTIAKVLGGNDIIENKTVNPGASNFSYHFSNNGLHHIHELDMLTGSTSNNLHIYVDGAFVAQEGDPVDPANPAGPKWSTFDEVSINDFGNYLFTGDTDAPTTTDEFVAYNNVIGVTEADTLDGIPLSGMTLRGASLNNYNLAAHAWGKGFGSSLEEYLFYGPANDLLSSVALLGVDFEIDVTGNELADYLITDFNASTIAGPGLDLADDGYVYIEVDMVPIQGGDEIEAILRLALPPVGCAGDSNCDGIINWRDIDYFVAAQNDNLSQWGDLFAPAVPTCPFTNNDVNADGIVNWRDIDPFVELQNTTCP